MPQNESESELLTKSPWRCPNKQPELFVRARTITAIDYQSVQSASQAQPAVHSSRHLLFPLHSSMCTYRNYGLNWTLRLLLHNSVWGLPHSCQA